MISEKQAAILRELREAAKDLTPGKRRDVLNKLDRVELLLRRGKSAPVPEPKPAPRPVVDEGPGGQPHFESQAKAVLAYMREGHTITSLEALQLFGIISFPRRILDIEKLTGTAPKRKRIQVVNRAGKKVYVNRYWLEETN
jgi:hypothetical protein